LRPLLLGVALVASLSHHAGAAPCEQVAGNLIENCSFDSGVAGWSAQAATTLSYDARTGNGAPGALKMLNEPASEAGAATCAGVERAGTYELSGFLRRLTGTGECLAFLEEHTSRDCSGGATHFHELVSTPLVPGTFTHVSGNASLARDTRSVKAGFACYGEQDDDVSGVLLDDVVLQQASP
jgi:hypothetical protein